MRTLLDEDYVSAIKPSSIRDWTKTELFRFVYLKFSIQLTLRKECVVFLMKNAT